MGVGLLVAAAFVLLQRQQCFVCAAAGFEDAGCCTRCRSTGRRLSLQGPSSTEGVVRQLVVASFRCWPAVLLVAVFVLQQQQCFVQLAVGRDPRCCSDSGSAVEFRLLLLCGAAAGAGWEGYLPAAACSAAAIACSGAACWNEALAVITMYCMHWLVAFV